MDQLSNSKFTKDGGYNRPKDTLVNNPSKPSEEDNNMFMQTLKDAVNLILFVSLKKQANKILDDVEKFRVDTDNKSHEEEYNEWIKLRRRWEK